MAEALSEPTMQSQFTSVTLLEASLHTCFRDHGWKNNILKTITDPCHQWETLIAAQPGRQPCLGHTSSVTDRFC